MNNKLGVEIFNESLNEKQLSGFVQTTFQSIAIFWQRIDAAVIYRIKLYIMNTVSYMNRVRGTTGSCELGSSNVGNVILHGNNIPNYEFIPQAGDGISIGVSTFSQIDEILNDRQKTYLLLPNMPPNRYCVVIIAEDLRGQIVAQTRGIEVIVYPMSREYFADMGLLSSTNLFKSFTFYPKTWNEIDYYSVD